MKSKVYFIKCESTDTQERQEVLKKLLKATASYFTYNKDEFVPVKLTIGDSACIYNISPELVKVVVSEIKKSKAKPFLFDTSVIYKGERQNAVDHLNLAQSKGFGHSRVGAPFIIADGVFGQDGREFLINEPDIGKIKVPSFIGMVDSLVVLSHVTGHIVSRYAGAIKNVAMGMSCRPAKQVQHSSLKPTVIAKNCSACGCCIKICPAQAISFVNEKAVINQQLCVGCSECICACKFDAIYINWHEDPHIFCRRMAETACHILSKFKTRFFINFAFDITKECDCISSKDEKMVSRNIGILASDDIVSLDRATLDLIAKNETSDFFGAKNEIYENMLIAAQDKGLGRMQYEMVEV